MDKLLLAVLATALVLRLLAANWHEFWFDEALTYHIARLPQADLLRAVLADNNPPLYYLAVHYFLKISKDPLWLRLPSLLFNLLTGLSLYLFAKKYHPKIAIAATSFFLLSPLSVYLATEARLHSLAALLLMLSVGTFFNYLKTPNLKNSLIFILITTLGFYTQYYLTLIIIPYLLVAIVKKLSRKKFLTLSLPLLALVPWLILSLSTTHNACWCPSTLLSLPSVLVSPIISGVGIVTLRSYPKLDLPTLLLFSSTTIAFLYFFTRGVFRNFSLSALYLIPLLVVSILGFAKPAFSPKAFAVFAPIYFAIVASGIDKRRITVTAIGLALLLVIISLVQIQNQFFAGVRLLPIYQLTATDPNLPIAHTSILTYYPFAYFSRETQNLLLTKNPLNFDFINLIAGQTQSPPQAFTFWLVDTEKWAEGQTRQQVLAQLDTSYYFSQVQTQDNITLYQLHRK